MRASGCGVLIEGTTFRGLLGGSAIVTEGEGTCPDPYYNLDVTGPINCTLSAIHVRTVNASFEDLHATDPGGAIQLVKGESLILLWTNFTNCTSSSGWGGAVYVDTINIEWLICDQVFFVQCTSSYSIVHVVKDLSERDWAVLKGCWFIDNSITDNASDISNMQCGGSGLEFQDMGHVTLEGCHFVNTSRSQGGSGGAYGMHTKAGSLTLRDCTFSETWAKKDGGCVAITVSCSSLVVSNCSFSRATAMDMCGGVFFFKGGQKLEKLTITDSVVDQISAGVGCFIYTITFYTQVIDFTMTNTTLNKCDALALDGMITMTVNVSGTFVFTNNTIANMNRKDAVKFLVTNTSLVFQDCTFENLECERFAISILPMEEGSAAIQSLVMKDCRIYRVSTNGRFNSFSNAAGHGIASTLENCYFEDITFKDWLNPCAWMEYYGSKKLSIRSCEFVGAYAVTKVASTRPYVLWSSNFNITECSFRDMQNIGALRVSKGGVLEDIEISNCSWAIECDGWGTLLCWGLNISKSTLQFSSDHLEVHDSLFTELEPVGGKGKDRWCYINSNEAIFEGCQFQGASTSEIQNGLIQISERGSVTFARCCFQGAPTGVAYIQPLAAGNVTFVEPICLDKTQEESFTGATDALNGLENCQFECTECEPGSQISESSEDLETTEPEPAETSEDLETTEPEPAETSEDLETTEPEPAETSEDLETTEPEPAETSEDLETTEPEPAEKPEDLETTEPEPTEKPEDLETTEQEPTETSEDLETTEPEPTETSEDLETTEPEPTEKPEDLETTEPEPTETSQDLETTELEPTEKPEDLETTEPEPAETSTDTKLGSGDSGNDGNRLSPGIAAGVAITVIAVVAVAVVLVVLFLIRRRKQDGDDLSVDMETVQEGASPTNPFVYNSGGLEELSL